MNYIFPCKYISIETWNNNNIYIYIKKQLEVCEGLLKKEKKRNLVQKFLKVKIYKNVFIIRKNR